MMRTKKRKNFNIIEPLIVGIGANAGRTCSYYICKLGS